VPTVPLTQRLVDAEGAEHLAQDATASRVSVSIIQDGMRGRGGQPLRAGARPQTAGPSGNVPREHFPDVVTLAMVVFSYIRLPPDDMPGNAPDPSNRHLGRRGGD
jgi:hypothetical protein